MYPVQTTFSNPLFPMLFNGLFGGDVPAVATKRARFTTPSVNILEGDKSYSVEVAAPGMTKDDFNIQLDDAGNLVIKMEKKAESREDGGKYLQREFSYSTFQQTFSLPDDVEQEKISAKMADGVLTIALPKKEAKPEEEKIHQIEIL